MATAPKPDLPLFYNDLIPVSTQDHAAWKVQSVDRLPFLGDAHAIPLTTDEFVSASRYAPIIFSAGDQPVPLMLMGLNEGVNLFFDADGKPTDPVYVPAYVRRYPFLLARLRPEREEMSLCMDPTSAAVTGDADAEGTAFFEGDQPGESIKNVLQFCEQFEEAGLRTQAFLEELKKLDLLMDGEVAIQHESRPEPFVYRGFKMVDEAKLRELRGDKLRTMTQNGMLAVIFAHLFSLQLMRDLFAKQFDQGRVPVGQPGPATPPAPPPAIVANPNGAA